MTTLSYMIAYSDFLKWRTFADIHYQHFSYLRLEWHPYGNKKDQAQLLCFIVIYTQGVDNHTNAGGSNARPTEGGQVRHAIFDIRLLAGQCKEWPADSLQEIIVWDSGVPRRNVQNIRGGDRAVAVASQSTCRHRVGPCVESGIILNRFRRSLIGPSRGYELPHNNAHWAFDPFARNRATCSSRVCSKGDQIPTSKCEQSIDKNLSQFVHFFIFTLRSVA